MPQRIATGRDLLGRGPIQKQGHTHTSLREQGTPHYGIRLSPSGKHIQGGGQQRYTKCTPRRIGCTTKSTSLQSFSLLQKYDTVKEKRIIVNAAAVPSSPPPSSAAAAAAAAPASAAAAAAAAAAAELSCYVLTALPSTVPRYMVMAPRQSNHSRGVDTALHKTTASATRALTSHIYIACRRGGAGAAGMGPLPPAPSVMPSPCSPLRWWRD